MSSSHNILEDFICSIAACSQAAGLEDLLKIVQLSQYPTIAVVDEQQQPIGVVNGSRLLASIVGQWSNSFQNSTKFVDWEQMEAYDDIAADFKLSKWIEPIVRFKSNLSLEKNIILYQQRNNNSKRAQKLYYY